MTSRRTAPRAARDMGMARIGTLTRWMAVGAVVGGGVLTAAVAKALPGHGSRPATAGGSSSAVAPAPSTGSSGSGESSGSGGISSSDDGSGSGLSAPVAPPQPVQSAPVVNSGGS